MKRGYFITLEGGEGAGKSTQISRLQSYLETSGRTVVVSREPGGTRIGEQIRAITHDPQNTDLDSIAEAYLMAASRAQHVNQIIKPALMNGSIVLCDRFVDSSVAYQGYGRGLGAGVIQALNELAVDGAVPNLTLLLDVPVDVGSKRRDTGVKVKDRLDMEKQEFYTRVSEGYHALVKQFPERFVIIDASQGIDEVSTHIYKIVDERLAQWYSDET